MLPSEKDTAFPLKQGNQPVLVIFFKFCNFRLPITKFCKAVFDEYQIHISQVHPLGLAKLRHFEFACLGLGHIPEILVFRAFFCSCVEILFFTFDQRDIGVSCLRSVPSSSRDKDWKNKFFFIDADVIPGEMHWREMAPNKNLRMMVLLLMHTQRMPYSRSLVSTPPSVK
ncbi:hypothetical protein HanXRQr2_Chr16g0758301 [Helianthus annuus]|uniref:Transposase (putative) gypsy type domain-containing protein n=1 Tax=Helianthus annuus TaxID=4232 RepID=A0A9K3GZG9_HELAN|nr:hypothetical protein HanXRQr2_Chr16g0758301 [Helianthus annuus]KAJ0438814.1 hypothetical protein HanHA300_Chr16g0618361 [Helianthus annuus]